MKKKYLTNQKGFTLIEVIIYVVIVVIMLGALVNFSLNIMTVATKSTTGQEVYSAARVVSERMKKEIRDASAVTTCDTTTLELVNSDAAKDPTVFSFSGTDITIRQGTFIANPVRLHSENTEITGFTCSNRTGNISDNVQINFTVSDNSTNDRQEYNESVQIQFSGETRE